MPDTSHTNDSIDIGQKLRVARQQQQLSLRELAERAEVSASLLSKIENSKATPSVRSLHSIAEALSLPVNYFFPEDQEQKDSAQGETAKPVREKPLPDVVLPMTPSEFRTVRPGMGIEEVDGDIQNTSHHSEELVVRATTRQSIELLGDIFWERLTPKTEEGVEFLLIYYEVGSKSGEKMSHHSGREFHFVLEGALLLELGFEQYLLEPGDSIIFDSTTPHRLSNGGDVPMRALSVILHRLTPAL